MHHADDVVRYAAPGDIVAVHFSLVDEDGKVRCAQVAPGSTRARGHAPI